MIRLTLLLLVIVLAYTSSMTGELTFDDAHTIETNSLIKDLPRFSTLDWLAVATSGGRPVGALTFGLNYAVHGLEVVGYHLVNVLVHLAVVGLVYWLSRTAYVRAGYAGASDLAFVTAGVFGLHPIQSQAVSYVAQRYETLASFFYLVALASFVAFEQLRPLRWRACAYLGALGAFVLGLGSKEIVVTLPMALVLYVGAFPSGAAARRPSGSGVLVRGLTVVPFFVLAGLYALGRGQGLRRSASVGFALPGAASPVAAATEYFLTQARVLVTYLRLIFVPLGQNLDYDFPPSRNLLEGDTLLALLLLLALGAIAVALWTRCRVVSFGIAWFFLVLGPTSSIVPIADVIMEHRAYLASWGIVLAAVAAGRAGTRWLSGRLGWRLSRPWGLVAISVLFLALGTTLYERNKVWRTNVGLWSDVVSKSPRKARAHMNLGHAYAEAGKYERGLEHYDRALELTEEPSVRREDILRNKGVALFQLGRLDEAVAVLREALVLAPFDADVLNNLAICSLEQGDLAGALAYGERAVRVNPDHGDALNTLGEIRFRQGEYAGALERFLDAIRVNPDIPARHYNAALSYERLGARDRACDHWRTFVILERDPRRTERIRSHMQDEGCG